VSSGGGGSTTTVASGGGTLPRTGSSVGTQIALALGLMLVGATLVAVSRRRDGMV
jgi:LPXTG-motif cell wall-anchored protein